MGSVPPKAAESLVSLLIPPACREHVLGDLYERCTSPRQYVRDAAATVPLVILSQIRRTTDPVVFLMEGFALYVCYLTTAWWLTPALLFDRWGFLRLAIPGCVMLFALMLADAYADPGKRSPLRPILGVALGAGCAFLSQTMLGRELALPRLVMIYGSCASILLISTLRMLFSAPGRPAATGGHSGVLAEAGVGIA
jgi:hypothetical protein